MQLIYLNEKTEKELLTKLKARTDFESGDIKNKVDAILNDVRIRGDEALREYTKKFDGVDMDSFKVSQKEIDEAFESIDSDFIGLIKRAKLRIEEFHYNQVRNTRIATQNGETLGQIVRPMEYAGVYVPGGKAFYPSSVLMNIVPAKIAGVKNIVMVTPPNRGGKIHPATLVTAVEAGADAIYKVGGAQAIGALAFGTETIHRADKIVGPGNIFVATAKKSVYGLVSIDSMAGPSEILIIADSTANSRFIAADLISQAEHDELASSILITTDELLARKVDKELRMQIEKLDRKEIINKSLNLNGAIIIAETIDKAIELSNKIAPEHLELMIKNPESKLDKVQNAGAIFLGDYSPEPLGDYMAGTNHILPTGGTARFFSALSVDDFIKMSNIISFNKEALKNLSKDIESFARIERLTAHANSIRIRFEEEE